MFIILMYNIFIKLRIYRGSMTLKKINNPRIMLVNPPFYRFITFSYAYNPLGNRYIAAMLRKHEYETHVYNFDFPEKIDPKEPDWLDYHENYGEQYKQEMENLNHPIWKEIETTLRKVRPDILGVTSMTPQMNTGIMIARLAKSINPDCIVVFGGIHPTSLPYDTASYPEIDIVCVGEGELTMLHLVQTIERGGDLRDVQGIAFFDKNNQYCENERRALIADLDSIPYPIRDFPTQAEKEFMLHRGSILTSRGCPYSCTFCARKPIWGKSIRYRSAESVVQELEYMHHGLGIKNIMFEDDTLALRFQRMKELFDLMEKRNININYTIQTKVHVVKPELLELLKKTGCTNIAIGVETGSQYTLDRIKKKITLDQVRNAVKLCKEFDIMCNSFFIVGYPWETKEMVQETFDFMKEIDSSVVHLYMLIPLPGTELYEEAKRENRILAKDWFYYYFQNPNAMTRDHFDNRWLYDKYLEIKDYIHKTRREKIKQQSRNFKYIITKVKDNIDSPKRLWYMGKRFIKIQLNNF